MASAHPTEDETHLIEDGLITLLGELLTPEVTPLEAKIDILCFYALNQFVYDISANALRRPNETIRDERLHGFHFLSSRILLGRQLALLQDRGNLLFGQPVVMPPCFTTPETFNSITVLSLFNQIFVQVLNQHPEIDILIIARIRRMIAKTINPPIGTNTEASLYMQRRVINYLNLLCRFVFLIPPHYFEGDGDEYLKDPTLNIIIAYLNQMAYGIAYNGDPVGANTFTGSRTEQLAVLAFNSSGYNCVSIHLPRMGDIFAISDVDILIEVKSSRGGASTANMEIQRKDNIVGVDLIPQKRQLDIRTYPTQFENTISFRRFIGDLESELTTPPLCTISRENFLSRIPHDYPLIQSLLTLIRADTRSDTLRSIRIFLSTLQADRYILQTQGTIDEYFERMMEVLERLNTELTNLHRRPLENLAQTPDQVRRDTARRGHGNDGRGRGNSYTSRIAYNEPRSRERAPVAIAAAAVPEDAVLSNTLANPSLTVLRPVAAAAAADTVPEWRRRPAPVVAAADTVPEWRRRGPAADTVPEWRRRPAPVVAAADTVPVVAAADAAGPGPYRPRHLRDRLTYDVNEEKDYFKLYLKYKNKYLQLKNM